MMYNDNLSLAHALAYQFTTGIHTHGPCARKDCMNTSRGSNFCKKHSFERLKKAVGMNQAVKLNWLLQERQKLQFKIDDVFEELSE